MAEPRVRSGAFIEFYNNKREIVEILRAAPSDEDQLSSSAKRQLANALYRGSVVLLSSHLERYVESLLVEAIDAINAANLAVSAIPDGLILESIRRPLHDAHEAKRLSTKTGFLKTIADNYGWSWDNVSPCRLNSEAFVETFDNPLPERITKVFRHFDIGNVVGQAVGLSTIPQRAIVEAKVRELVEKRNSVAHAGMTSDITRQDVIIYLVCTYRLARGIDVVVGSRIQGIIGTWPWKSMPSMAAS